MSGPFATAAEFCEFTGMSEPSNLARLQSHLELASALVRSETGQTLSEVQGDSAIFLPVVSNTLFLPQRPVTTVTSVLEPGSVPVPFSFNTSRVWRTDTNGLFDLGATVTYSHGYTETSEEFKVVKLIVIEAAARAFTLNERSSSEAMGSTLMESAGYAPEVFLTQGEKNMLNAYTLMGVG